MLLRELDCFEQLGALEAVGAFDFELIRVLLGDRPVDRYDLWRPSIAAMGDGVSSRFGALAEKMRRAT